MATTLEKLRGLVESLCTRTQTGTLTWIEAEGGGIYVQIGSALIILNDEPGSNFENDIRVSIYSDGNKIDSFTDTIFSGHSPTLTSASSYYQLLSDTLSMGRRQASGAEMVLDQLLKDLEASPAKEFF